MGIRDFIQHLREHREKAEKADALSDTEREKILYEAELMVGMAEAAVKELESVVSTGGSTSPKSTPSASPKTSFSI